VIAHIGHHTALVLLVVLSSLAVICNGVSLLLALERWRRR
jgi:hypothetical protein